MINHMVSFPPCYKQRKAMMLKKAELAKIIFSLTWLAGADRKKTWIKV